MRQAHWAAVGVAFILMGPIVQACAQLRPPQGYYAPAIEKRRRAGLSRDAQTLYRRPVDPQ